MQAIALATKIHATPLQRLAAVVVGSLALATGVAPAQAALKQFTTSVEVSSCNGNTTCNLNTAMPTQTFMVNDTVDYTVDFTGAQRLIMSDVNGGNEVFGGWLDGVSASGTFTIAGASITLLNQIGTLTSALTLASQTSGSVHIGPYFNQDFISTGASVSFTGYRVQYTVMALPAHPTSYSTNWFILQGDGQDRLQVVEDARVPEPATLALTAIGLAGLALIRRRRTVACR